MMGYYKIKYKNEVKNIAINQLLKKYIICGMR